MGPEVPGNWGSKVRKLKRPRLRSSGLRVSCTQKPQRTRYGARVGDREGCKRRVTKIVAVIGQKGGVGKTTCAVSLAAVAAAAGNVMLLDADPQKSAYWWCEQVEERQGEAPFDYDAEKRPEVLQHLRAAVSSNNYDTVFVDTPGSLEDERALAAVLDNSDFAILPIEPAGLSVRPLGETLQRLVQPRGLPYAVLLNRVDGRGTRAGRLPRDVSEARMLLTARNLTYFQSYVRTYAAHKNAPVAGEVVTQYTGDDARNAVTDYQGVAVELLTLLGRGRSPQPVALHAVGAER